MLDGQNVVGIFDVSRHEEIDGAVGVIPGYVEAEELVACPVGGDFIFGG